MTAALLAVLWVTSAAVTPTARSASSKGGPTGDEARLLELLNTERAGRGRPRLIWNAHLTRLARAHVADMRRMGRATHDSSKDGAGFTERLIRSGGRAASAAENVAFAENVQSAHRGLMRSPGHRKNILDGKLTHVGLAVLSDVSGWVYVVQDFAALLPDLDDRQVVESVRQAIGRARKGAAITEDRELSRKLAAELAGLMKADSVKADARLLRGTGWISCYTTMDPDELPAEAARRARGARGFALAAAFGRTPSNRLGAWWVLLALENAD
ncbi:MAG TPA: CAP domain-containing protein [Candidatus Polarisedimenticolia bacterium]|nr:CAP domain-containing protein [Candidatus Polarisedimenticolia bacterium]